MFYYYLAFKVVGALLQGEISGVSSCAFTVYMLNTLIATATTTVIIINRLKECLMTQFLAFCRYKNLFTLKCQHILAKVHNYDT